MKKFIALTVVSSVLASSASPALAQGPVAGSGIIAFAQSPSPARWLSVERLNNFFGRWFEGRVTGHEEITRQALVNAKRELIRLGIDPESRGIKDFLKDLDTDYGVNGFKTRNLIIQGNYATDFPMELYNQVEIKKYLGAPRGVDYDLWTGVQPTHLLRYPKVDLSKVKKSPQLKIDDLLTTQENTCYEARARILQVTLDAAKRWEEGEQMATAVDEIKKRDTTQGEVHGQRADNKKAEALFLIGHATHTIQDSFSPDHGRRDLNSGNNDLLNICYYGDEVKAQLERLGLADSACFHPVPGKSLGDLIWIRTQRQYDLARNEWKSEPVDKSFQSLITLPDNKETSLKHEARLARAASTRYYFVVAKYLHEKRLGTLKDNKEYDELIRRLNENFFEGNAGIPGDTKMPNGVFRCDRLQEKVIPSQEETITEVIREHTIDLFNLVKDHSLHGRMNELFVGGALMGTIKKQKMLERYVRSNQREREEAKSRSSSGH